MNEEETRLRALFARYPGQPVPTPECADNDGGGTPAAVLVPLVRRAPGLQVLLTKRSEALEHHAGQISFPGGRVEAQDASAADTALREAREEIGLAPEAVEILGELPQYRTTTGFSITPQVAIVTPPFALRLQTSEVDEAFELPFACFCDPAHYRRISVFVPSLNANRDYFEIVCQQRTIWGATAGILWRLAGALRAQADV